MIKIVGLDIAKNVFQVPGIDETGQPALRRKLRRAEVLRLFCHLEPALVGIEACHTAHHWGRVRSLLPRRRDSRVRLENRYPTRPQCEAPRGHPRGDQQVRRDDGGADRSARSWPRFYTRELLDIRLRHAGPPLMGSGGWGATIYRTSCRKIDGRTRDRTDLPHPSSLRTTSLHRSAELSPFQSRRRPLMRPRHGLSSGTSLGVTPLGSSFRPPVC